jgi:hypothetical protein
MTRTAVPDPDSPQQPVGFGVDTRVPCGDAPAPVVVEQALRKPEALDATQKREDAGAIPISPSSIFVSYTQADRVWAEWIAWTLEDAGYPVKIQAWDFRPGSNFVVEMDLAARESDRTVVVLSSHFLQSGFTQPEWTAAFARDPKGREKRVVPVRIDDCTPDGLLRQIVWIDLVGLSKEAAQVALLRGLKDRDKPLVPPSFPEGRPASVVPFPGSLSPQLPLSHDHLPTPHGQPSLRGKAPAAVTLIVFANAFLLVILGVTFYFLLEIYAPFLHLLVGAAGLLGGILAAAWGVASRVPDSKAPVPRASKVFALGLAAVTVVAVPGTFWARQASPILRIEPGTDLIFLLGSDASQNAIKTDKAFEIVVIRNTQEEGRFFPKDARPLDFGSKEKYLRWRAIRELKAKGEPEDKIERMGFLNTANFRVGDRVRVSFRCRRGGSLLVNSPEVIVAPDLSRPQPVQLEPVDSDDFFRKAKNCEPIDES